MSKLAIHGALRDNLTLANLGYPIEEENYEVINTATTELYIAEFFMPVTEESLGKNSTSSDESRGIYQVSVYGKDGGGRRLVRSVADQIQSNFPYNRSYTRDNTTVTSMNTNQSSGRNSDGRYIIDVSINWFSYILR